MEEVPGGGVAVSEVRVFKRVSKFIDYGGPKFRFPGLWTTIFMFWWSCVAFSSADGAKYLLKDGIGYLVDNRDKNKMAEVIISLLNDRSMLKNRQRKMHEYVEEFSLKKVQNKWLELFKKLGE